LGCEPRSVAWLVGAKAANEKLVKIVVVIHPAVANSLAHLQRPTKNNKFPGKHNDHRYEWYGEKNDRNSRMNLHARGLFTEKHLVSAIHQYL